MQLTADNEYGPNAPCSRPDFLSLPDPLSLPSTSLCPLSRSSGNVYIWEVTGATWQFIPDSIYILDVYNIFTKQNSTVTLSCVCLIDDLLGPPPFVLCCAHTFPYSLLPSC